MRRERTTITVNPSPSLQGELTPPGDKSISHRAAILNSLSMGKAEILNFAPGRDCLATVTCLRNLGVRIRRTGRDDSPVLSVRGKGPDGLKEATNVLDARDSATTMRLLGGLLSGRPFLSVITGNASLRSRPMDRLIEPLRLMGADISGRGGDAFAPLAIRGKQLHGIEFSLPVPSAQIKSALLLAGLHASGDTTVCQPSPSRDHTERMLSMMGARLQSEQNLIYLRTLDRPLTPVSLRVPGDISSAAYFLVAGAVHPDARVVIRDCGINPTRTGIIDALLEMGARLTILNERVEAGEP
ncbi:MAG: 3-phosphoshikimate 1-carboxyvinyltransferase, partial [Dehalococcoidia bacterium]